jgi:hypothetical protein
LVPEVHELVAQCLYPRRSSFLDKIALYWKSIFKIASDQASEAVTAATNHMPKWYQIYHTTSDFSIAILAGEYSAPSRCHCNAAAFPWPHRESRRNPYLQKSCHEAHPRLRLLQRLAQLIRRGTPPRSQNQGAWRLRSPSTLWRRWRRSGISYIFFQSP